MAQLNINDCAVCSIFVIGVYWYFLCRPSPSQIPNDACVTHKHVKEGLNKKRFVGKYYAALQTAGARKNGREAVKKRVEVTNIFRNLKPAFC